MKYKKHLFIFWFPIICIIIAITLIGEPIDSIIGYLELALISGLAIFLVYKTNYILVNNDMVEGRTGIINIKKISSNKSNITYVATKQGIIGNIFNFGTVQIGTASSKYLFRFMKNPEKIKNDILNNNTK